MSLERLQYMGQHLLIMHRAKRCKVAVPHPAFPAVTVQWPPVACTPGHIRAYTSCGVGTRAGPVSSIVRVNNTHCPPCPPGDPHRRLVPAGHLGHYHFFVPNGSTMLPGHQPLTSFSSRSQPDTGRTGTAFGHKAQVAQQNWGPPQQHSAPVPCNRCLATARSPWRITPRSCSACRPYCGDVTAFGWERYQLC